MVEIDRGKIVDINGTQYIKVPTVIRREKLTEKGDPVIWERESNESDPTVRFEK